MLILYYAVAALAAAGAFFAWFRRGGNTPEARDRKQKISSLAMILLFSARYLGGRFALLETRGLNIASPFGAQGGGLTLLATLVLWMTVAAQVLLSTYPFYKHEVPCLERLVPTFALLTYVSAFVFLGVAAVGMDGAAARSFCFRDILFALEVGGGLAYSLSVRLSGPHLLPFSAAWRARLKEGAARKRIGRDVSLSVGMLLCTMPVYVPQVLFGYGSTSIVLNDMTPAHRMVLYGLIAVPVVMWLALRKQDWGHRRYALLFFTLGMMISYSYQYDYSVFTDLTLWPLHLCNTAMFIVPLVLAFKWDKLYYFTLFINVLGALFAMLMPNTADGLNFMAYASVQFWLNHYCAFLMPLVIMALNVFERPKLKQLFYSLIAFFGYYVLVLFVNAYFTTVDKTVDFFFINSSFIADKLGDWAKNLRNFRATLPLGSHRLVFYPIYQVLYFFTYVALTFAMWFVYEQFFEITDLYGEIARRNQKIKADRLALEVAMAGRSIKEPFDMEATDQLILKQFSKRYATSSVYAVKDADLTVHGGEIFGFLGPNGAGKSTIIKSIVGIQTITSGAIEVCGYDVAKQPVEAKMQIGFVPDHYALYENLTGREYINYIADLYGVSEEDRTARIDEYVARFRLEEAFDNQMKTYSHGMKQKITIMAALVHDPKLWILDEPLTGLDPESIYQVKECMKAHAAKGNIVFFSSHIIDVVERICDRVAIIRKGTILCTKTVQEIEETGVALEDFYLSMIDGNNAPAQKVERRAPDVKAFFEGWHHGEGRSKR